MTRMLAATLLLSGCGNACSFHEQCECDLESTDSVCDGDVRVRCSGVYYTTPVDDPTGFVVREDCAAAGGMCVVAHGRADCELPAE